MPKIYEYLGLIFFFYANEHLPIHVHVSIAEFESKFQLEFENGKLKKITVLKVKGRLPLLAKDTEESIKFIRKYHEGIVEKWTKFFVQNKKVSCEVINKKVR
jgi:murein L,D-transpeptidase YafK